MKSKSFTLIELLVVIVIIGILAGVIMISTSSSIDKASRAKAITFSASVQESLLSNLVSEWTFNEGDAGYNRSATNNDVKDTWGSNNATVSGPPQLKGGSDCVFGKCLSFNGSTNYVDCGNKSSLEFEKNLTISFWVYRNEETGSSQAFISKLYLNDSLSPWASYTVSYDRSNNNKLEFFLGFTDNSYVQNFVSDYPLSLYTWYNIVVTYDGYAKVYINGENKYKSDFINKSLKYSSSDNVFLGKSKTIFFNGSIDDVRFYNAALSSTQIKQNYIAGLNSMLANGNILKEEYSQIIKALGLSF